MGGGGGCCVWGGRVEDASAAALWTLGFLTSGSRLVGGQAVAFAVTSGLVTVRRILLLMADLLVFRKRLPLVLDFWGLVLPLFADDLGDFRVGETGVLGDYVGLVMLTVQDES